MSDTQDDGWRYSDWADGTQQWAYVEGDAPPRVFIERVVGDKSRRKRWAIVDRRPPGQHVDTMYPPKLAGPFPTLESAKAAYRVLRAAGRFDWP